MKVIAHLHYVKASYMEEGEFQLWPCKIEWDKEKMFLKTMEIDIEETDIPSQEEINQYLITGLKKEKEALLAKCHIEVTKIEDQIQQLLCLPAPSYKQETYSDILYTLKAKHHETNSN